MPRSPVGSRVRDLSVALIAFVLIGGFYIWSASPEHWLASNHDARLDYYNLLVDGFRSGHLSLRADVSPQLAKLSDPYDPAQNAPYRLHDVSYFKGRFYLYFGITPALTLFWPYLALTGHYLSDVQACGLLSCAGLACALLLLLQVRWRFFPTQSRWALWLALFALGLCPMMPSLLRRIAIWEVPITAAYAFAMLSLLCLFHALYGRRRIVFLALASLAYGLAVGARPTYAFGALALWVPVYLGWRQAEPKQRRGRFLSLSVAAAVPLAVMVTGLLLYNYERFGNPVEFGQNYQLSGVNEHAAVHFSPSYLAYNLRVYLLAPARLSPYFPFVKVINPPVAPPGYLGIEDPYGVIPNLPVVCFMIALWFAWRRLGDLRPFISILGIFAVFISLTVFSFGWATNRYMLEFLPTWILLSAIGFWASLQAAARSARAAATALGVILVGFSSAFSVGAAFSHNDLLRLDHPKAYEPLARALDWPSYAYALATGTHYRPIKLTVRFPQNQVGKLQPLVVSGVGFQSDYLYLYYAAKNSVVIGYEHTGAGGPVTQPIAVDFAVPHEITIEAGFLYPPPEHPYFAGKSPDEVTARKAHLRICIDGVPYIQTLVLSYDPVRFEPLIGHSSPDRGAFGLEFTGTILKNESFVAGPTLAAFRGERPLQLAVKFPPFTRVHSEPLVNTGATGRADNLYVSYLDAHHITVGLDDWGTGGPTSPPIEVDYDKIQLFEVSLGSFFQASGDKPGAAGQGLREPRNRHLTVLMNGQRLFDAPQKFHPAAPEEIRIGSNPVGASSSEASFTGTIVQQGPSLQLAP